VSVIQLTLETSVSMQHVTEFQEIRPVLFAMDVVIVLKLILASVTIIIADYNVKQLLVMENFQQHQKLVEQVERVLIMILVLVMMGFMASSVENIVKHGVVLE